MKTKSIFLAIAMTVILLTGCSKDKNVSSDNELMKLYESFEAYDGMKCQDVKNDLNEKGYTIEPLLVF